MSETARGLFSSEVGGVRGQQHWPPRGSVRNGVRAAGARADICLAPRAASAHVCGPEGAVLRGAQVGGGSAPGARGGAGRGRASVPAGSLLRRERVGSPEASRQPPWHLTGPRALASAAGGARSPHRPRPEAPAFAPPAPSLTRRARWCGPLTPAWPWGPPSVQRGFVPPAGRTREAERAPHEGSPHPGADPPPGLCRRVGGTTRVGAEPAVTAPLWAPATRTAPLQSW